MRIAEIGARAPHEDRFISAIAKTAVSLGHELTTPDDAELLIQWGARPRRSRPTLYCELGWLPRWSFQVSHTGINAEHHQARPQLDRLTREQRWKVDLILKDARSGKGAPPEWGYLNRGPMRSVTHADFILAPLQMPDDVNMDSIPENLRSNHAFIYYVSERDLPHPVYFKQHPNSQAAEQLSLVLHREQDVLWPHTRGTVYQLLESGHCRGVIARNSNVVHDALLYDIPSYVLGLGVWPRGVYLQPNFSFVQDALFEWTTDADSILNRESYIYALSRIQWTMHDAADPRRVGLAIGEATR
jgi:hypothetical protein